MARARRTMAGLGVLSLTLVACSGGGSPNPVETTTSLAIASTVPADGVLRLGFLLPQTGPGASLGASLFAGAQLAVDEINRAGGVLGRQLAVVSRDEGASTASASVGLDELIDEGIDAVIGPASSRVAYEILPRAVRAEVLVCSPTSTAIGLSSFPDDHLFVRPVPSDALQAVALARLIEQTGKPSAAVIAPDDDYGNDFAAELEKALRAIPISITGSLRYDPASDTLATTAELALASGPEAIAVIGSGDSGAAMLSELRQAAGTDLPVFVNDSLGSPSVVELLGEKAAQTVAGVRGTTLRTEPAGNASAFRDRFAAYFPDVSDDFAAYAFDCVNLIALAAVAANSDQAQSMSMKINEVSTSGDECSSFAECAPLIEQPLNANLLGASGELDIGPAGDALSGTYHAFEFDDTGRAMVSGDSVEVP